MSDLVRETTEDSNAFLRRFLFEKKVEFGFGCKFFPFFNALIALDFSAPCSSIF